MARRDPNNRLPGTRPGYRVCAPMWLCDSNREPIAQFRYHIHMTAIHIGEEIEVERLPPPLLSTRAASQMAGVAWRTWPLLAKSAGISPIRASKRVYWRRTDVLAVLGLRESA